MQVERLPVQNHGVGHGGLGSVDGSRSGAQGAKRGCLCLLAAQLGKLAQLYHAQGERHDGFSAPVFTRRRTISAPGDDIQAMRAPRALDGGDIAFGGALPRHGTAGGIGALAHGLTPRVIGQKI
ncbi:MAG TPA: hypothetical protein PK706_13790, partial [Xanthobacteraceae bacterium]|nr:hypothetical protein [Xanthobacteraceae bacterium]